MSERGNSVPKHGNSDSGITHYQGCYAEHPECAAALRKAIEQAFEEVQQGMFSVARHHIYRQLGLPSE